MQTKLGEEMVCRALQHCLDRICTENTSESEIKLTKELFEEFAKIYNYDEWAEKQKNGSEAERMENTLDPAMLLFILAETSFEIAAGVGRHNDFCRETEFYSFANIYHQLELGNLVEMYNKWRADKKISEMRKSNFDQALKAKNEYIPNYNSSFGRMKAIPLGW